MSKGTPRVLEEESYAEPGGASDSESATIVLDRARVAIEVLGLCKSFQIPEQRLDTLKERLLRPNARRVLETLVALDNVSFEVEQGEFFGVVGRNGSGKSTLLKILASIYQADAGGVRIAGRLAPFIELGVGFNPELSARQNVQLNGVLMGLSRREALGRLDAILDFAGLQRFADLKVKNFSSGMMVRLAFSVMIQADAQILLVDEILAVGDAAFADKCIEVFRERRAAGTTIVLVTHDMATVRSMCDRAMLLERGRVAHVGSPEEVAMGYSRLNADSPVEGASVPVHASAIAGVVMAKLVSVGGASVRLASRDLADEASRDVKPIAIDAHFEAAGALLDPRIRLQLRAASGAVVTSIDSDGLGPLAAGSPIAVSGSVETHLAPGEYFLDCWIRDDLPDGRMALQAVRLASFEVSGEPGVEGFVIPSHSIEFKAGGH